MSIMGKGGKIRAGLYTYQSPRLWALTESVLRLAWPRVGPYSSKACGLAQALIPVKPTDSGFTLRTRRQSTNRAFY